MDRHQRGRAGGLHGDARAAQVELVGDPGGEEVLVVAARPSGSRRSRSQRRGRQAVNRLRAGSRLSLGAGEDADPPGPVRGVVAGVLERLPGAFQEERGAAGPSARPRAGCSRRRRRRSSSMSATSAPAATKRGILQLVGRHPGRQHLRLGVGTQRLAAADDQAPEASRGSGGVSGIRPLIPTIAMPSAGGGPTLCPSPADGRGVN